MTNFNEKQDLPNNRKTFTKESNTNNTPDPRKIVDGVRKNQKKDGDSNN